MKNYVLDLSCIDSSASGAKQRILSIYKFIIAKNHNVNFTLIYTDFLDIKKKFKFNNVVFKKNPFNQKNLFFKILSVFYVYFYLTYSREKYDVIEHFTLPFIRIKKCINVVTIHDFRKIYFSKFFFTNLFFKLIYKIFLSSVNKIIVVSFSAKKELEKYFKYKNIFVSYNVISDLYSKQVKQKELLKIKKKYNLPRKFLISVGHLEKRKNFIALIQAIKILKDNKKNFNLIIIGQNSNETKKINNEIRKLNLNSNIKIFSNLTNYEVLCFYKLADVFVYPSLYEGFGIPMLESMATKLPIVLSDTKVFREITNNKYYYFDPKDPLSIANKIRFVSSDISVRKSMIDYGIKRIRIFKEKHQGNKIYKNIFK